MDSDGQVSLAGELDREVQEEYNITITVTDRWDSIITAPPTPIILLTAEANHKEQLRHICWSRWRTRMIMLQSLVRCVICGFI